MREADLPGHTLTVHHETATIRSADELALVLDVLHGQHDRLVLDQLRPHLANILGGPSGCLQVMRVLSTEDRVFLVTALGEQLASTLRDARHLREVLATCGTGGVADAIIDTLGAGGVRSLILSAADLADVLEWMYGTTDGRLLTLLGPAHIRRLIRTGHDMSLVLNALDARGQEALVEMFGWAGVARLVIGARDLTALMRALPAPLSRRLLDELTPAALVSAIGSADEWAYLYARLEPAEATVLRQKLGVS